MRIMQLLNIRCQLNTRYFEYKVYFEHQMQFEHQTPFELAAFVISHKACRCKGCHLLLDHLLLDHQQLDYSLATIAWSSPAAIVPWKASILKGLEAFDLFSVPAVPGTSGYFSIYVFLKKINKKIYRGNLENSAQPAQEWCVEYGTQSWKPGFPMVLKERMYSFVADVASDSGYFSIYVFIKI